MYGFDALQYSEILFFFNMNSTLTPEWPESATATLKSDYLANLSASYSGKI